jgi:hypothetical protein
MTATITANNGAGATAPVDVLFPYEPKLASRNVMHELIGGGIAVSLVAPNPRSGDLSLLYDDAATAWAAIELHKQATTFTLTDLESPWMSMVYFVAGDLSPAPERETRGERWLVTITYQEVLP